MTHNPTDHTLQIIGAFVAVFLCGFGAGAAAMWWWPAAFVFLAGALVGALVLAFTMALSVVDADVERAERR